MQAKLLILLGLVSYALADCNKLQRYKVKLQWFVAANRNKGTDHAGQTAMAVARAYVYWLDHSVKIDEPIWL